MLTLDTYGEEEGDPLLPSKLQEKSPIGFEFVGHIHGETSCLLSNDAYSKYQFRPVPGRLPDLTGDGLREKARRGKATSQ